MPDYRKAPAHPFPAFMDDAATAAAWARAHAAEYGGDPARIHWMGHSAGAHMVALLATDPRYLARRKLRPRDFASVIGSCSTGSATAVDSRPREVTTMRSRSIRTRPSSASGARRSSASAKYVAKSMA